MEDDKGRRLLSKVIEETGFVGKKLRDEGERVAQRITDGIRTALISALSINRHSKESSYHAEQAE